VFNRVGDPAGGRDVGNQGLGSRVLYVTAKEVVFQPGLAGVRAAVDGKTAAMIQDIVNGLKPEIRQISGFDAVDVHAHSFLNYDFF
jgi:hypothetical protein